MDSAHTIRYNVIYSAVLRGASLPAARLCEICLEELAVVDAQLCEGPRNVGEVLGSGIKYPQFLF